MRAISGIKGQQGVGAGSAYIIVSFAVSGVLTYVFQAVAIRALTPADYGGLALLWAATFSTVQILWIGSTQTLGRYLSEREALGQGWEPVLRSVRRWQIGLLAVFVTGAVLASPLLTDKIFGGNPWLTAAFIVAVAVYAPEYFRRGIFNGHRQFSRLGGQLVAEASSRVVVVAITFALGVGLAGPVAAIVLAPIIGVLAVRPAPVDRPDHPGEPFSAGKASRFAAPVLVCMACAQAFANGGPILVKLLGGTQAQAGLFFAALILTRVPQYVLSPAIGSLLPHASRVLATQGSRAFDRFILLAVGAVGLVGLSMVAGTWLFGELAMRLFTGGSDFGVGRGVLVALAALAAFYLLSDMLNQALFARALGRLAALAWLAALPVSALCMVLLRTEILYRISVSLVLGVVTVAVLQTVFYLLTRER